jgi:hypothetical protein
MTCFVYDDNCLRCIVEVSLLDRATGYGDGKQAIGKLFLLSYTA